RSRRHAARHRELHPRTPARQRSLRQRHLRGRGSPGARARMIDEAPPPAVSLQRPRLSDEDRARLVRSAAALVVAGASIVMMFQLLGPWLDAFVSSNQLAPRGRRIILLWTAAGALLGAVTAALLY